VTKPVTLEVEGPSEPIKDRRGLRMGASATTKINRTDFGLTNMPGMVGTDVAITIDVELVKPSTPAP
jgi:polyisoprenoid-binding protein YceI